MKTIGFRPENFDLLLKGPTVKSTTIRVGDKTKRFHVGERIEARCNKDHRAVECEVTRLVAKQLWDLTDQDARADGFGWIEELHDALRKLNRHLEDESIVTIIGLRLIGEVRDTRFEAFSDEELDDMGKAMILGGYTCPGISGERIRRRKPEVQG